MYIALAASYRYPSSSTTKPRLLLQLVATPATVAATVRKVVWGIRFYLERGSKCFQRYAHIAASNALLLRRELTALLSCRSIHHQKQVQPRRKSVTLAGLVGAAGNGNYDWQRVRCS